MWVCYVGLLNIFGLCCDLKFSYFIIMFGYLSVVICKLFKLFLRLIFYVYIQYMQFVGVLLNMVNLEDIRFFFVGVGKYQLYLDGLLCVQSQ